jgi:hypothetical protein
MGCAKPNANDAADSRAAAVLHAQSSRHSAATRLGCTADPEANAGGGRAVAIVRAEPDGYRTAADIGHTSGPRRFIRRRPVGRVAATVNRAEPDARRAATHAADVVGRVLEGTVGLAAVGRPRLGRPPYRRPRLGLLAAPGFRYTGVR